MADYTIDFSAVGTNDPYALASPLVELSGTWRSTSGKGIRIRTASWPNAWAAHNVDYGSTVTAEITIGEWLNSDLASAGVFVRSGGNATKGYIARFVNDQIVLYSVASDGTRTLLASGSHESGAQAGDVVKIVYNKSNGSLKGYLNGTEKVSATDTTYQSESSLAAGFYYDQGNNYGTYISAFAGTGVATTKKLKVLTHSSAAGSTGVAGVVYSAPTGSDITGSTKIGEFTGKAFESSLESNQAVLKVSCAAFGGSSLTTSDAPVALVRNTNNTTGIVSCTVIEE